MQNQSGCLQFFQGCNFDVTVAQTNIAKIQFLIRFEIRFLISFYISGYNNLAAYAVTSQKGYIMVTIEQIRNMPFYGNFFQDGAGFAKIEEFAASDTNPVSHRAEALRRMYKDGMGLEGIEACDHFSDNELVEDFVEDYGS